MLNCTLALAFYFYGNIYFSDQNCVNCLLQIAKTATIRKSPLYRSTISAFASQDSLRNVNEIGDIAHESTNTVIMKNNSVYPDLHVETKSIGSFVSCDSTRNLQRIVHREVHDSSLRRLSKHWKMVLIMLIPVLSLLALVTNNLLKAAEVKKNSGLVITEVNIAQKVAGLIQMLQRERGISATYLSAMGNKTEAWITMMESRQHTDSAFTDVFVVNRHLVYINGKPHSSAMLKEIVLLARERIENGSVLVEDHLTFYTDLNNGLMNVMFKDVSLYGDQSYFADIIAFSSLIRWTDIIGLLRARIAFQYTTCGFDTITLQSYMLLTGQAQAYKITFTSYSDLMMNEFSKQKQSTEEYLYEVRNTAWDGSFRNSCLTLSKEERLSLGLNWFKNITKFIDFAFEIKEKQSQILTNRMLYTRAQAEHEFNLYLSVQIVTTVLSFILTSWYIVCIDKLTFKIAKHTITIKSKTQELMVEKRLTEKLLFQMLPKKIATTLKERGEVSAEYFSEVSVLFSDIVNFTELGSRSSPLQIIDLLNDLYG